MATVEAYSICRNCFETHRASIRCPTCTGQPVAARPRREKRPGSVPMAPIDAMPKQSRWSRFWRLGR